MFLSSGPGSHMMRKGIIHSDVLKISIDILLPMLLA